MARDRNPARYHAQSSLTSRGIERLLLEIEAGVHGLFAGAIGGLLYSCGSDG